MKPKAKHAQAVLVATTRKRQCIKPLNRTGHYLPEYKGNIRVRVSTNPKAQVLQPVSSRYFLTRYLIISICFSVLPPYLL
jgi:hypothetical protein